MIFVLLTLLAALSLAAVSGWFSIVGVMAIYAGAPMHALIMGVVLELGKLVTTSWVYRNWDHSGWRLKGPLIAFTLTLMLITSIGVFGFLSKSHLEQGAKTIDNAPRVERLEQQIAQEKSSIADKEIVIKQLDDTIKSYIEKNRADRSLTVRRTQDPQRQQLRNDIDAANRRIDGFNEEKFKLQSEIRAVQLEVGPIRYIAELIYGSENNSEKNIEGAVKIFTLLIVSSLDPLAIILLMAANHSLMRRQKKELDEDEEKIPQIVDDRSENIEPKKKMGNVTERINEDREMVEERPDIDTTKEEINRPTLQDKILNEEEIKSTAEIRPNKITKSFPVIRSPNPSRLSSIEESKGSIEANDETIKTPLQKVNGRNVRWEDLDPVIRELLGPDYFVPLKVNEEKKPASVEEPTTTDSTATSSIPPKENIQEVYQGRQEPEKDDGQISKYDSQGIRTSSHKYPKVLSWLLEFKR
jgi:hypothetical protein